MQFSGRTILHLDLDSFFVSVERLKDPSLIGKPVIVGAVGHRGVVSSCSYEARAMGVHAAMSSAQAHRLCPNGIYLRGDSVAYSQYSRMVTEVIAAEAPLYEKASIDEFYIDLTGMDKYFGAWKWSVALREKIISATGLPISFGLSVNKMLAKMATNAGKPNGQFCISPGTEQEFLDPLPVGKIPFVGEKLEARLVQMGIRTVAELRAVPLHNLMRIFGKTGVALYQRARGEHMSEVHPYREEKSVSVERTFDEDTADVVFLHAALFVLTEKLSYDLRKLKRLTACVTVKIRYHDFTTVSRQTTIHDTLSTTTLIQEATALFDAFYEPGRTVRLIGIRFSHLTYAGGQMSFFDQQEEETKMYAAIDEVKKKYGNSKIVLARGMDIAHVKRNRDVQAQLREEVNRSTASTADPSHQ
ncbi:MAG: DNA polymerase IV [Chitinophagales bacterium]